MDSQQAFPSPEKQQDIADVYRVHCVLDVDKPALKAEVARNGSQLLCCLESHFSGRKQALTALPTGIPLCDKCAQDLRHHLDHGKLIACGSNIRGE